MNTRMQRLSKLWDCTGIRLTRGQKIACFAAGFTVICLSTWSAYKLGSYAIEKNWRTITSIQYTIEDYNEAVKEQIYIKKEHDTKNIGDSVGYPVVYWDKKKKTGNDDGYGGFNKNDVTGFTVVKETMGMLTLSIFTFIVTPTAFYWIVKDAGKTISENNTCCLLIKNGAKKTLVYPLVSILGLGFPCLTYVSYRSLSSALDIYKIKQHQKY